MLRPRYRRLGNDPMAEVYGRSQEHFRQQTQEQLNVVMGNVMSRLEKQMKDTLLRNTAQQLAVNAALYSIPVAGQALAVIGAVAMQVGGAKYQAEAEKVLAEAGNKLKEEQEKSLAKISKWLDAAFEAEKRPAMELAVSGEPLQGLRGLRGWNPFKDAKRAAGRIEDQIKRSIDDVSDFVQEELIDPMTGRSVLVEARKARDRILREGREKLREHEQHAKQQIDSPAFRATLRANIAQAIRQQLPPDLVGQGLHAPSGGLVAPAIAAGAVIAASLLGFK